MKVFFNDSIINEEHAKVSIFDHGFLYGDGIFETIRAYNGIPFMLREHIDRLKKSAELISLNLPYNNKQIIEIVNSTLSENKLSEAYIRLTLTRGIGPIGLDIDLCKSPTFLVITRQFTPYPEDLYKNGMKVIVSSIRRNIPEAVNPAIKSLNFLNNILAKRDAKHVGAQEALMFNNRGHLAEGTISNLFFCDQPNGDPQNTIIYTPSLGCGILEGITRNLVIKLARDNGIEVREGQYFIESLYQASEVFLTNTSMEVMPVNSVDLVKFKVGEITRFLIKEYCEYRRKYNDL